MDPILHDIGLGTYRSSGKMDPILQTLDFWTEISIEAHWKELVREAQEINKTATTLEDSDTSDTSDTSDPLDISDN